MKSWIMMTLGWALVLPLQVVAQPATPSDLPPAELARAAIEQEPSVVKARYALEAAGHAGRRIAASPYEWSVGVDGQRRRYDTGGDSNAGSGAGAARLRRIQRLGSCGAPQGRRCIASRPQRRASGRGRSAPTVRCRSDAGDQGVPSPALTLSVLGDGAAIVERACGT